MAKVVVGKQDVLLPVVRSDVMLSAANMVSNRSRYRLIDARPFGGRQTRFAQKSVNRVSP